MADYIVAAAAEVKAARRNIQIFKRHDVVCCLTYCRQIAYMLERVSRCAAMIRSFRNKQLQKLWAGTRSAINPKMHERIFRRLDRLDAASKAEDTDLPGFDFHGLHRKPKRYSVHVNGPWCITFEFESGDAYRVDFEQYH